jgi:hypothetical protein
MLTRRRFLGVTAAAGAAAVSGRVTGTSLRPVTIVSRGESSAALNMNDAADGCAMLAAQRLRTVALQELKVSLAVRPLVGETREKGVVAVCGPWDAGSLKLLRKVGMAVDQEGRIAALSGIPVERGRQGFVVSRLPTENGERLLLAAETKIGLRNALLTLSDRLYRDSEGNVVADPFDGVHFPAFDGRHLKTDAMYCGPFHMPFEYWDPTSAAGVHQFADWLASFRITDYALLAFVRGWGLSYRSQRFPALVDPNHPNSQANFYPGLIDRMHDWGIKVWASDIYIASGYSMEVGTVPEMLSPCSDAKKLRPFKAGQGTFAEILEDPEAVVCLSNPRAAQYYAEVVDDLLLHYPRFDGLDFHIGHTFSDPRKICRCPKCRNLVGNREGVYNCFKRAYEAAVSRRPDIRMRASVRMFADATRRIEERHEEFPNLEFFCWLRWVGSIVQGQIDAPVLIAHEDGGGGLEAFSYFKRDQTITQLREYHRGWEAVVRTYVSVALSSQLPAISWEPAFQRELEQVYFFYSQLTWEPTLTWAELARRYVLRSERRIDDRLAEAYRLALEANAAVTCWGLIEWGPGYGQFVKETVLQTDVKTGLLDERTYVLERSDVRERLSALRGVLREMGLLGRTSEQPPVAFDLRWSLVKTLQWLENGQLFTQH